MRLNIRLRMFLSSYAPLFALLALRFDECFLVRACAGIAAVGALAGYSVLRGVAGRSPVPRRVSEVKDAGAEVAGYLATYLLPFVTVSDPSGRDIAAYLGFILVSGIIYVQSEMMQVNPLLYLLGFRVSLLTTEQGWRGYVIHDTRQRLPIGSVFHSVRLDDGLVLATKVEVE